MKIPAIMKSRYFLLFIAIIVVIVLVGRRDGYTWKLGTPPESVPSSFWTDTNVVTIFPKDNVVIKTNEAHIFKTNKTKRNPKYPYCYPSSNVATGQYTCFKSSLKGKW
jgi:hypothetical protein